MPPALQQRTLGLPRWAWLLVITGGVVVGVIIRNREKAAQSAADATTTDPNCDPTDPNGDCYDPTAADSGFVDPTAYTGDSGGGLPYAYGGGNGQTLPVGTPAPITITVNGGPGAPDAGDCGKPPKVKLPKGLKWECHNGRWVQTGTKEGGGNDHNCPKGHKWDRQLHRCVPVTIHGGGRDCPPGEHKNPKGQCVKDHPGHNGGSGGAHHGPKPGSDVVLTGGGPPNRYDHHSVAPSR